MTDTSKQINYFGIGAFILIGAALIIAAIIFLSTGSLFSRIAYFETYFNESVQGLTIGSPVKYRGLTIGYVKKMSFINEVYRSKMALESPFNRYIYVEMAITSSFLTKVSPQHEENFTQHEIANGLRTQLALQGLTGNAYIELNYVPSIQNPPLPIDWKPHFIYIPSTKSSLTHFSDNAQAVLENLKKVNFEKTFNHIDALAVETQKVIQKTNKLLLQTQETIVSTVNNANSATNNINMLLEEAKGYPAQALFGRPPKKLDPNKL